jgi:hypothetical protein
MRLQFTFEKASKKKKLFHISFRLVRDCCEKRENGRMEMLFNKLRFGIHCFPPHSISHTHTHTYPHYEFRISEPSLSLRFDAPE